MECQGRAQTLTIIIPHQEVAWGTPLIVFSGPPGGWSNPLRERMVSLPPPLPPSQFLLGIPGLTWH